MASDIWQPRRLCGAHSSQTCGTTNFLRKRPRASITSAATGAPPSRTLQRDIALGATASFPVGAQDLIKRGMKPGPALGRRLAELEDSWVASDFALTRGALLDG